MKIFLRDYLTLKQHGAFDERYYLRANKDIRIADADPLKHYLLTGWQEGRNPSEFFNTEFYLSTYPDVKAAGFNPYVHYLRYGRKEGRLPLDPAVFQRGQAFVQTPSARAKIDILQKMKTGGVEFAKAIYHKLPLSETFRFRLKRFLSLQQSRSKRLPAPVLLSQAEPGLAVAAEIDPVQPFLLTNPFSFGRKFHAFYSQILSRQKIAEGLGRIDPPWYEKLVQKPSPAESRPHEPARQGKFLILSLVDRTTPAYLLSAMIDSVLQQPYNAWELHILVNEGGQWKPEILAMPYQGTRNEDKVVFHELDFSQNTLAPIQGLLDQLEFDFVLFLNPLDELGPGALAAANDELTRNQAELVYSKFRSPVFQRSEAAKLPADGKAIPLAQLIVMKKEKVLPALSRWAAAHANDELASLFLDLLAAPANFYSIEIGEENYLFRLIPQRCFLAIAHSSGAVELEQGVLPFNVVVDARLINRKITGTERYIKELLTHMGYLSSETNLTIKAITFSQPAETIDGVEFVTQDHLGEILNAHLFHKTFPASDWPYLNEMALAPSVVFSPLDLIAYNNPDYFASESEYTTFRKNIETATNLSDQVIAISKHGKSELAQVYKSGAQNIQPVYLGIRTDQFSRELQPDEADLSKYKVPAEFFLYVGTDYPHKNLITLLNALKVLRSKNPKAALVIVGVRYYVRPQPEITAALKSLGDRVIQLGHVPEDVLIALYRRTRALVFPSLYEGFGLPILEAMAMGTPVIATRSTSVPEVCGDAALLFDGRDANQLAGLMERIGSDDELRREMSVKGLANVARFNWQETARQTIETYRKTVENAIALSPYQKYQQKRDAISPFSPSMPTILIVTHIRFYPPTAGNEQRLIRLVKYLKKLGYRILMLVNSAMEKDAMDNQRRRVMHDYVDYYEEISDYPAEKYIRSEGGSPSDSSALLEKWLNTEMAFCPDEMLARAKYLVEKFSPKIILAEYIWTSRIFELAGDGVLKVIDLIDLFSTKKDKVIKYGIKDTLAVTPEEEIAFLNRGDVVIAIQEKEAEILRSYQPQSEVILAGIDYEFQASAQPENPEKSILIIGSDNHINRMCINEFLTSAWPQIHHAVTDCVLKVVGKIGSTVQGEHANLQLVPFVEDLDPVYAAASLVMNPVFAGTGLKIKSVEALGHGKALVAWPEGVSGIAAPNGEKPFVEVESWEDLIQQTVELLLDAEKRARLEGLAAAYTQSELSAGQVYRVLGDRFDLHARRQVNILCLYLRYGPNDFPGSLEKLFEWYQGKQKKDDFRLTFWIIDNKLPPDFDGVDLETGFRLLSGDNAQREFSGFQKVIQQQRGELANYDLVHFVTSAFNQLFTGYLDYFELKHLYPVLHRDICLGHIDSYDRPVTLMDAVSQSWIRTCFFFISPRVLFALKDVHSLKDKRLFFNEKGEFQENAPVERTYRQYIQQWLSGKKMQGVTWHGKVKPGQEFADKALTILNEHMLSIRLRGMGVKLVDYYWLMKNIEAVEKSYEVPLPTEMEQVQVRNKGLFNH